MTTQTWLPVALSLFVALVGSGGALFGALRYNRDEAGKVVIQQTAVLTNMQALNDELQGALERARSERDELISELQKTRQELGGCQTEIKRLRVLMERSGLHGTE